MGRKEVIVDKLEWPLFWRTSHAPTFTTQNRHITPMAGLIGVRWPGGGYVWQFPLAVKVVEDDQTVWLPIVDVTRITVWLFQKITWASILLLAMSYLRRRKSA